jgi:hypothetical protein
MKKIANIVTSPTKYTEDLEWSEPISYKIKLLQNTDWIVQQGSGVVKQHKWLQWREAVRKCTRNSSESPNDLQLKLEKLDSEIPKLIRYNSIDFSDISLYKETVIKLVKYYYCKKLDIDIATYLNNILLLEERYKEAKYYLETKDISKCHFIKSYMDITGKDVESTVQFFIEQKEFYFILLLRNQKEVESKIKEINNINEMEALQKIYEEYNVWISTLTLTPLQI